MTKQKIEPTFLQLARFFAEQRKLNPLTESLSYDDVTIIPNSSDLRTIDEVSVKSELVPGITLEIPFVSANMKTVTEVEMSIFMARVGGIGIIHRALSIEEQVAQVREVKDATKYIVEDPPALTPKLTVGNARKLMEEVHRGFALVIDTETQTLLGLVTRRDLHRRFKNSTRVTQVMTPREKVVIAPPNTSMQKALKIMYEHRVEKLPLVDENWKVKGVITDRDIEMIERFPLATRDEKGRLRVGAAIGVQAEAKERIQELVKVGVDVLVVDVLHGDSRAVWELTKYITENTKIPVIAGNICTTEASLNLINHGSKANKTGYGDGALCITRRHTGTGRGQFTSVVETAAAAYPHHIPVIADGSIRNGGDVSKAIAAGAKTVMVGTLLAGTSQSPGQVFTDHTTGERFKEHYGMASNRAREELARARGGMSKKRYPQGIESRIAYVGDATPIIESLVDGLKHGIANVGARSIDEFQQKVVFERQPHAVQKESEAHFLSTGRRR